MLDPESDPPRHSRPRLLSGVFADSGHFEVALYGSGAGLEELAEALSQRRARVRLDEPDTRSLEIYGNSLFEIVVSETAGHRVRFSLDAPAKTLLVDGDRTRLDILAGNIASLATVARVGYHQHIEYYPDHFFLDPTSESVVVTFVGNPNEGRGLIQTG